MTEAAITWARSGLFPTGVCSQFRSALACDRDVSPAGATPCAQVLVAHLLEKNVIRSFGCATSDLPSGTPRLPQAETPDLRFAYSVHHARHGFAIACSPTRKREG
jgi:hypothetical protein